jgi:hypothetical protein
MIRNVFILGVVVSAIATGVSAEQVNVPSNLDGSVETIFSLTDGHWYLITVSGEYFYNKDSSDKKVADAEWVHTKIDEEWEWVETPSGGDLDLLVNGVDIVMMGKVGPNTFSRHVYSASHTYRANIRGTGDPFRFSISDGDHGDNSGDLHVIIELGRQVETITHQMGDTNADGVINSSDYGNLRSQLGGTPDAESNADFNGDGFVNLYDFAILRSNFGASGEPPAAAAAPVVNIPEPVTLIFLTAGLPLLLKRRRPLDVS